MSCSKEDTHTKNVRESTKTFRALSAPLKDGPDVKDLKDLIEKLNVEFATDHVNFDRVNHLMLVYKSNPKDWECYANFNKDKYTRNLVDRGNSRFNLILLCWNVNQGSVIHDHADAHCFMKILQGTLTETRYDWPNAGKSCGDTAGLDIGLHQQTNCSAAEKYDWRIIGKTDVGINEVAYMNDHLGVHKVSNESSRVQAVSLHLYCPPFNKCGIFDTNTGKQSTCDVTFYSEFGKLK